MRAAHAIDLEKRPADQDPAVCTEAQTQRVASRKPAARIECLVQRTIGFETGEAIAPATCDLHEFAADNDFPVGLPGDRANVRDVPEDSGPEIFVDFPYLRGGRGLGQG